MPEQLDMHEVEMGTESASAYPSRQAIVIEENYPHKTHDVTIFNGQAVDIWSCERNVQ